MYISYVYHVKNNIIIVECTYLNKSSLSGKKSDPTEERPLCHQDVPTSVLLLPCYVESTDQIEQVKTEIEKLL